METILGQLQLKFSYASKIFEIIDFSGKNKELKTYLILREELKEVEREFIIRTAPFLVMNIKNDCNRMKIDGDFLRLISYECYGAKVDRIIKRCKELVNVKDSLLKSQIDIYPNNEIRDETTVSYIKNDVCKECGGEMLMDNNENILYCNNVSCNIIMDTGGIIYDDLQLYTQEGQKYKSGTFNPNRHFHFWWTHILAREGDEELGGANNKYGEQLLNDLRTIIKKEKIILRMLTINDIRRMLKILNKSDLNKNTSLILKKLTGIGPPNIPDNISIKVENLFTKAIDICEKVRKNNRINRNYYPYYIYRIIESITDDPYILRVLYYIYIQSEETVKSDDNEWEQICYELKEIQYKPTNRHLGKKYAPYTL